MQRAGETASLDLVCLQASRLPQPLALLGRCVATPFDSAHLLRL